MEGCDPATPDWLCWTGAEMQFGVSVIAIVVFVLGVRGIIKSHQRRMQYGRPPRGADSGPNDLLMGAQESPILGLGHGNPDAARTYRVTRDPQTYAKAFVPEKNRKK